jgi:hypothetical protein
VERKKNLVATYIFRLLFPTRWDSATFGDKGTEAPSLSLDKGTTVQAENLAKGQDGLGQPVKIRDGMRNGTVRDFDSCPIPSRDKTRQSRKGRSKTGEGRSKTGKGRSKTGEGRSKTEKGRSKIDKNVLNRKGCSKTGI